RKPAPPVISALGLDIYMGAAYAYIFYIRFTGPLQIVEITPVKDDGVLHVVLEPVDGGPAELIPFGTDDQRIDVCQGILLIADKGGGGQHLIAGGGFKGFDSLGIIGDEPCAAG